MSRSITRIYREEAVAGHPRCAAIVRRLPGASVVDCRRWGEVFNRRRQDFRLQKRRPALILAAKHGACVLPTPPGYGVGGRRNYYFSHLLNCLYDCRYCFLQGMFRSANYVLFVNYEAFQQAIDDTLERHAGEEVWFFSGYDCDSLALERLTGFARSFVPFFAGRPRARLELRTKSVQVAELLGREPLANVVVAFSFTPEATHRRLEHGVPSVGRRLAAMRRLGERGWPLGLRFDPLLWSDRFPDDYRELFATVFAALEPEWIHSVSLGGFRLPKPFYDRAWRLYPDERLFAEPWAERDGVVGTPAELEAEMVELCRAELGRYLPAERLFLCAAPGAAQPAPRTAAAAAPAGAP